MMFGSTTKTTSIPGVNKMGVKSDVEVGTVVGNTADLNEDGTQENAIIVSLFDLNSDAEWPAEGEGEPNTPPPFITLEIVIQEEIGSQNLPKVKGQSVKKNKKRRLSNNLAKGLAKSIDRFSDMYIKLRERKLNEICACVKIYQIYR